MKIEIFILMLVIVPCVKAQTLTPQKCLTDRDVWGEPGLRSEYDQAHRKFIEDKTPDASRISKLPITEVFRRMNEMGKCMNFDEKQFGRTPSTQRAEYNLIVAIHDWYREVETERLWMFLDRHNLTDQMLKEDEQGLR
jgi:hypothetical protein